MLAPLQKTKPSTDERGAAAAVTSLNVEPGKKRAAGDSGLLRSRPRLLSTWISRCIRSNVSPFGSNDGSETAASASPVLASITSAAPPEPPACRIASRSRRAAKRCRLPSSVR